MHLLIWLAGLAGLVRVFAEVYPVDVCKSISSCTVAITGAAKETLTVPAIVSHADAPMPLHCIHQAGLRL